MNENPAEAAYALTDDRMTLVVKRRAPGGILTITVHRQKDAGPFTDEDVTAAIRQISEDKQIKPGQRNATRRSETRFGIVWTDVCTGPPTWWLPRVKRKKDGALMVGWLRLAVTVKLDRSGVRS